MSGPSFHLEFPSRDLFKFPPDWAPPALPPSQTTGTLRAPFSISAETYNALLSPKVPATIATVYAITVTLLNRYNKSRGNKPWAISKTKAFFAFVILHNVFLAVYSGITNVAMARALYRLTPGLNSGLVENVDAYCKIHGPRGLGNAVTFNNTLDAWGVKNPQILLGANNEPDPTDVGRLWNEGLAFWGWWFYLSKFYEVLDTVIILAKGKRSSTLQTYHHAGAMLCMWAGIRFISPPIWMFVFINSGIHALMVSLDPNPRGCENWIINLVSRAVYVLHRLSAWCPRPATDQAHPDDHANRPIRHRRKLRRHSPVCLLHGPGLDALHSDPECRLGGRLCSFRGVLLCDGRRLGRQRHRSRCRVQENALPRGRTGGPG